MDGREFFLFHIILLTIIFDFNILRIASFPFKTYPQNHPTYIKVGMRRKAQGEEGMVRGG